MKAGKGFRSETTEWEGRAGPGREGWKVKVLSNCSKERKVF